MVQLILNCTDCIYLSMKQWYWYNNSMTPNITDYSSSQIKAINLEKVLSSLKQCTNMLSWSVYFHCVKLFHLWADLSSCCQDQASTGHAFIFFIESIDPILTRNTNDTNGARSELETLYIDVDLILVVLYNIDYLCWFIIVFINAIIIAQG